MLRRTLVIAISAATLGAGLVVPQKALSAPEGAVKLLNAMGCRGCHRLGGFGGTLGPSLDKVGTRLEADQLRQKLIEPQALRPGTKMPSYSHLKEADLEVLVKFLRNLR